jgi:hypothetical protein
MSLIESERRGVNGRALRHKLRKHDGYLNCR